MGRILVIAMTALLAGGAALAEAPGPMPAETVQAVALPLTPDRARALDPDGGRPLENGFTCLARTVYFEAKGEGVEGMRAVAHVVRNRVESGAYPDRLCDVVKDGRDEGPCQFHWWCDGRPDLARDLRSYATARDVAREVLNGESVDPTGGATMFHYRGVNPGWARRATRTAVIGNHVFYRLPKS